MTRDDYWHAPELWPGETVIVLAGGPSLDLATIGRVARAALAGACRVIAINDSVWPAWWADALYACDGVWWEHNPAAIRFPGLKVTLSPRARELWPERDVRLMRIADAEGGLAAARDAQVTGRHGPAGAIGNGGYQAIGLAAHLGARRVGLLGYDMQVVDGRTHWHGGHAFRARHANAVREYDERCVQFRAAFRSLPPALAARGIEVVNLTPGSALDVFPRGALDAFLQDPAR